MPLPSKAKDIKKANMLEARRVKRDEKPGRGFYLTSHGVLHWETIAVKVWLFLQPDHSVSTLAAPHSALPGLQFHRLF